MTVSVRIFYILQKFPTCFVTCNTNRVKNRKKNKFEIKIAYHYKETYFC